MNKFTESMKAFKSGTLFAVNTVPMGQESTPTRLGCRPGAVKSRAQENDRETESDDAASSKDMADYTA
jgi:hypothetical protein